jgi:hypothetical protein
VGCSFTHGAKGQIGKWIPASEGNGSKLCDFLYPGTEDDDKIWMLCSCKVGEAGGYRGTWAYWREAEELPADVDEYEY